MTTWTSQRNSQEVKLMQIYLRCIEWLDLYQRRKIFLGRTSSKTNFVWTDEPSVCPYCTQTNFLTNYRHLDKFAQNGWSVFSINRSLPKVSSCDWNYVYFSVDAWLKICSQFPCVIETLLKSFHAWLKLCLKFPCVIGTLLKVSVRDWNSEALLQVSLRDWKSASSFHARLELCFKFPCVIKTPL